MGGLHPSLVYGLMRWITCLFHSGRIACAGKNSLSQVQGGRMADASRRTPSQGDTSQNKDISSALVDTVPQPNDLLARGPLLSHAYGRQTVALFYQRRSIASLPRGWRWEAGRFQTAYEDYGVPVCSIFYRILFVCCVFTFVFPFGIYVELDMLCMISVLANTINGFPTLTFYAQLGVYIPGGSTVY